VRSKFVKIDLFRNDMKFSAAHFTIFSATKRENIHGHNYYIKASLTSTIGDNGLSYDYRLQRQKIIQLCKTLNEHFLIPQKSPYLSIKEEQDNIHITFNHKTMILPKEDIKILPLRNISSEELSYFFVQHLTADKNDLKEKGIIECEVGVATTIGQTSTVTWNLNND
jgi:6-pyruvoyltetrahydropterin/6-carboxytetrahydropterin synthase